MIQRPLEILFVGDSWQGASDRSLRESLSQLAGTVIRDIASDHYLPRHKTFFLKCLNRVFKPLYVRELQAEIIRSIEAKRPDVVVVYKGSELEPTFIEKVKSYRLPTVNVFPDHSPNTYGRRLKLAIGRYDCVITTKPYHPTLWKSLYGYDNYSIHVPHGYDPTIHCWSEPSTFHTYDVALCATWRPEYHQLMLELAERLRDESFSFAIAGHGWSTHSRKFPKSWHILPSASGRAYADFLRSAKIVIAPVNRMVRFKGKFQPGDEDSTRSYELAAMHCFFLHQRTQYIESVYNEHSEVPLWNDSSDLAVLIKRWLPDSSGRVAMARRAHIRAVPMYSIPQRASRVFEILSDLVYSHSRPSAAS